MPTGAEPWRSSAARQPQERKLEALGLAIVAIAVQSAGVPVCGTTAFQNANVAHTLACLWLEQRMEKLMRSNGFAIEGKR